MIRNGRIVTPQGLIQGQKLLLLLRQILASTWKVDNFDDLPIPYRAVAADILSGKPVVWGKGDLVLAIRSSMSVPGAVAPAEFNGMLLVDGMLTENLPVDTARKMGADIIIAVNVGTPLLNRDQLKSVIGCGNAFGFGVRVFPGYRFYSRSSARSENRVARRGTTSGERLVK
jgi:NTE family protein